MGTVIDLDPVSALRKDHALWDAVRYSDHPACKRFMDWLCDDLLPALDGPPGPGCYVWSGTQLQFEQMLRDAISGARMMHPVVSAREQWAWGDHRQGELEV